MHTAIPHTIAAARHWKPIGHHHHHGIDIPLASIHTCQSGGIGEFLDLLPLIDWCASVGMDIIQLLPLNDSGHDPSPYNALSSCALHPIYLSLHALDDFTETIGAASIETLRALTLQQRIPYTEVNAKKTELVNTYLDIHQATIASSSAFKAYFRHNPWTVGYGLFKVMKTAYNEASWKQWPKKHRVPTADTLDSLIDQHEYAIERHCVIQYLCWKQLREVRKHATTNNILLKGDIPILLSPDSADVWLAPTLFDMSQCAGAPPDAYAKNGQNWGFPLYDWAAVAADDYAWWRQRLAVAEQYYQLYRIDHIIGFFRLWAVAPGKSGKHGQFIPADPSEWVAHGERILTMMLNSCGMLPIGEDLGIIPQEIRESMLRLGIPGMKVMRWEREWDQEPAFHAIDSYPPFSMTTVSTHDSEPLGQWWELRKKEARLLCREKGWKYTTPLSREHRMTILRDSHASGSLFHVNLLQEYLALFPELVWGKPSDERINTPGTVSNSNWTYRYRPSIEALHAHDGLKGSVRAILHRAIGTSI
ncbi:4-alpha-glucanotransferase [Chlamydiales bacterium SCGC AG-110-P3]|nr:4-alpha-glucanotransferase [Chlamydiales bacterium SCGC AG-110-P3]